MAGRIDDCRVIHIAVEGRIRTTYGIDDDEIEIFCFQFFQAVLDVILGFGGETRPEPCHSSRPPSSLRISTVGFEIEREVCRVLLDFLRSDRLWAGNPEARPP